MRQKSNSCALGRLERIRIPFSFKLPRKFHINKVEKEMSSITLPSWPPALSEQQYTALKDLAVDWALAHGLVLRALVPAKDNPQKRITSNASVIHAPFALFPTPFPKKCYTHAKDLQHLFNLLVHKISLDHQFLEDVMETLSKVDDFTGRLYEIYKVKRSKGKSQNIELGIHRSDYLLHFPKGSDPIIQQVELNTIASSFAALSFLTGDLHKYLLNKTDYYNRRDDPATFDITPESLVNNPTVAGIAKGIAKAHELYGSKEYVDDMLVALWVHLFSHFTAY
ncbi:eukaryotic glutathione synthase [Paraphysoderma sedebokerense]|nr:eukaryotic glutathione synthase [Paraphysoderma sedebokerense]